MPIKTNSQLFDLSGKVAIVTGGAMGIGQGIAFRLAEAGAAVIISDVNAEAATVTVNQMRSRGWKAEAVKADAASVIDARKVAQTAAETFGSLDILVNNAGIFPISPALEISEQLWDKVLAINLKGTFFYSQAAAAKMIEMHREGKIINIASIDSLHPTGQLAHYDASKGGVHMVTKALALELAPHGIKVNAIAPGVILTPGAKVVMGNTPGMSADAFTGRIPLARMGDPDDIAKVALFLASAAADYMTGSLVVVDGGYLLS